MEDYDRIEDYRGQQLRNGRILAAWVATSRFPAIPCVETVDWIIYDSPDQSEQRYLLSHPFSTRPEDQHVRGTE